MPVDSGSSGEDVPPVEDVPSEEVPSETVPEEPAGETTVYPPEDVPVFVFISPTGNREVWAEKPEGYFTEEEYEQHLYDQLTIEDVKKEKLAEIAQARLTAEEGGMKFGEFNIATDQKSQAKITGAALQAVDDPTYACNWKTSDGVFIQINAEQIKAVAKAVRTFVQSCFDKEWGYIQQINAATTKDEVHAIKWE